MLSESQNDQVSTPRTILDRHGSSFEGQYQHYTQLHIDMDMDGNAMKPRFVTEPDSFQHSLQPTLTRILFQISKPNKQTLHRPLGNRTIAIGRPTGIPV